MYLQLSMTSYKYLSDIECIYDQDSNNEYNNITDTTYKVIGIVYAVVCVVLLYKVFMHQI